MQVSSHSKLAVDFFVVGDYGWVRDLTDTNLTFDALDQVYGNAVPGSFDDADFIVTVGDNLYPLVDTEPTTEEFEAMLNIFQRPHLKDLKVHAVRGNHDAYFAWDAEIKLNGRND
jgi:hypothetical protein